MHGGSRLQLGRYKKARFIDKKTNRRTRGDVERKVWVGSCGIGWGMEGGENNNKQILIKKHRNNATAQKRTH